MTPENAKALLPIITAYAEGKTIQVCRRYTESETWSDIPFPDFNDAPDRYRIKPEPKRVAMTSDDFPPVFWIRDMDKGTTDLCDSISPSGQLESRHLKSAPAVLEEENFRWSTDRKTWHSFMKEVQE